LGKEGIGEIFEEYVLSIMDFLVYHPHNEWRGFLTGWKRGRADQGSCVTHAGGERIEESELRSGTRKRKSGE
jgi:hypothetical protein